MGECVGVFVCMRVCVCLFLMSGACRTIVVTFTVPRVLNEMCCTHRTSHRCDLSSLPSDQLFFDTELACEIDCARFTSCWGCARFNSTAVALLNGCIETSCGAFGCATKRVR